MLMVLALIQVALNYAFHRTGPDTAANLSAGPTANVPVTLAGVPPVPIMPVADVTPTPAVQPSSPAPPVAVTNSAPQPAYTNGYYDMQLGRFVEGSPPPVTNVPASPAPITIGPVSPAPVTNVPVSSGPITIGPITVGGAPVPDAQGQDRLALQQRIAALEAEIASDEWRLTGLGGVGFASRVAGRILDGAQRPNETVGRTAVRGAGSELSVEMQRMTNEEQAALQASIEAKRRTLQDLRKQLAAWGG
jgi:hypothetical protein